MRVRSAQEAVRRETGNGRTGEWRRETGAKCAVLSAQCADRHVDLIWSDVADRLGFRDCLSATHTVC
jgi:hypothetical protein